MTDRSWTEDAQRFLDGDGEPPTDAQEQGRAARFAAALGLFAADLRRPSAELDERVLGTVRARVARKTWWRWFIRPRRVVLRPVWAAAAGIVLIAGSVALTWFGRSPSPSASLAGSPAAGTVLVRFELVAPGAHRVALAGSFNGWNDSTLVFSRGTAPDVWTVTVALAPGEYQYLFVVDGERWIQDPRAHAQVEDEFGHSNSLLVVGPRGVVRS